MPVTGRGGWLPAAVRAPVAAHHAGHQEDADGREDDLEEQFDPVDAVGVRDAGGPRDRRSDERRDDADEHRHENPDALLAGNDEPAECADYQADDESRDDAGDGHGPTSVMEPPCTSWISRRPG